MAGSEQGYSVTPTQRVGFRHISRKSDDLSSKLYRPPLKDNRAFSTGSGNGSKVLPLGTPVLAMPGSFSTDLRSATRPTVPAPYETNNAGRSSRASTDEDATLTAERRQALVRDKIAKEMKIKIGTENMLEALLTKSAKQSREQRQKVEMELGSSNRKLAELKQELDLEIQRAQSPTTPPSKRTTSYFRGSPLKSPTLAQHFEPDATDEMESESPTVILTETLQALEVEGMQPEYYIDRANTLVELFKRHPTLKYNLAWSVFSGRVQLMLLSESTDVVAAGYRLTRHAITDRTSLQTIRGLHTDDLVTLSLVKKGKAVLEREQAVKFVRAFFDVKDGVHEISRAVICSLVAVAESQDDRLKNICLLTLAELMTKQPAMLVSANGLSTLADALSEGTFPAPEGLVASFMSILDHPRQRIFLSSGREFETMFAPFTDPLLLAGNEEKLKICAKGISAMLKTWPGFLTLAMNGATALRSLIDSLVYPNASARDLVLELLFDVLRIKPPSWSSSYLAGRRLTTYGRITAHVVEPTMKRIHHESRVDGRFDLSVHFTAIVLAILLRVGLITALMNLIKFEEDSAIKRKATLLLTEVLKLAHHALPSTMSTKIQVLGDLMSVTQNPSTDLLASNTSIVYQIESINRTMNRTGGHQGGKGTVTEELAVGSQAAERSKYTAGMDPEAFRQALLDTGVPGHSQYMKWNWKLIHNLIEGPLTNPKRLEEAQKSPKFVKRLVGFYRPFKYRFSTARNTRPNQRYVRIGYALVKCLCQTSVGIQILAENKLLRQIAECLAQVDRHSGLTSATPLFERQNMIETLSGGYFSMLGALSESSDGIQIMERWHMMNMFYHIIDQRDREDLIKLLLGCMDFSLDTHLRVMLSKALTSARKEVRIYSTKILRKYAVGRVKYSSGLQDQSSSHWALQLVLTQLYDPDVEVCEIAVKILEEACDQPSHLEYVVKCRPALDHLGEIGAPLLLRFLSISTGYRYLSGLDYIHQEMDDWFLGRNDSYVAQVEASLARAYLDPGSQRGHDADEAEEFNYIGVLPAHFYRELARTTEGCKLLRQSGHFYEFACTIRDYRLEDEDHESLIKVKGCLWAIGNIGSMELGSPFLEENLVVKAIVRIAEGAEVMSVRGTACFVLGLISRTVHGFEMLRECGWDVAVDANSRSLGICIPEDPSRLCLKQLGPPPEVPYPSEESVAKYKDATNDDDPMLLKILQLTVDMGNSVMYKKIAAELHSIKLRHPASFSNVRLFKKTLFILESHHYRLQARQFVLDLFDKSVLRQVVLEEELLEDEEIESETETS